MPLFEQAWKGKGTLLDWVWFGGYTFSLAAVTWLHEDGGKRLVSVITTSAWVVAPLARVTVCGVMPFRDAALPIWVPVSVTPETPGYPNRVS